MAKREGRPRVLSRSRHGLSLLHLLPDAASLVKHTWPTTPGFRIRSGMTGEGQLGCRLQMRYRASAVLEKSAVCSSRLKSERISV